MYNIKYITRNSEDYKNKQKVYFSCHPDDLAHCLDILSDDILKHSDCTVFYDEDPSARYDREDYENLLLSSNLIVVPVTEKYLFTPNRSREFDLEFAAEHFIPVLPVMMEQGLVQAFSNIIGDIQFLDRTCSDITAVSYDEKLGRYLESVLADNAMLQKIRDAFDARIFLSYRKKDRAFANRLMELIHENDFCRDIAIWYDEMLIAGEDFNASIRKSLEDCDIFALAVTPNLLEDNNYVLKNEYPLAKELNKDILAAQLQVTDTDAFARKFDAGIEVVDISDTRQLSEKLLHLVKKIGIREQNSSPDHRFFIGLAYLDGIEVERNTKKAVELIKSAADDGVVQAKTKLVNMYLNGDGVQRNPEKAVVWQKRLIEQLEDEYDENPTEAAAAEFVKLMHRLCEILDRLMRYEDILDWAEDMEYYCNQYKDSCTDSTFWRQTEFISAFYFAKAYRALGINELAIQYYFSVNNMVIDLYRDTGNEEYGRLLVTCSRDMSDIFMLISRFSETEEYIHRNHQMCIAMCKEVNALEDRINLITSHLDMGSFTELKGDIKTAQQHFSSAYMLARQLNEEYNIPDTQLCLAETCDKFGKFYSSVQKPDKSSSMHNEAIALYRSAAEKADSPYLQMQLALSFYGLSTSLKSSANSRQTLQAMDNAILIMEKLEKENPLRTTRVHLLHLYCSMAKFAYNSANYTPAYVCCNRLINILELEKSRGNYILHNLYGFEIFALIGQMHKHTRNDSLALHCYSVALEFTGYIVEKIEYFKTYKALAEFSLSGRRICRAMLAAGEKEKTLDLIELLLRLHRIVEENNSSVTSRYACSEVLKEAAEIYSYYDEYEKALACLEELMPHYSGMIGGELTKSTIHLGMTYFGWICQLCTLTGRADDARRYRSTAEELCDRYRKDFADKDEFYKKIGIDPTEKLYNRVEFLKSSLHKRRG